MAGVRPACVLERSSAWWQTPVTQQAGGRGKRITVRSRAAQPCNEFKVSLKEKVGPVSHAQGCVSGLPGFLLPPWRDMLSYLKLTPWQHE